MIPPSRKDSPFSRKADGFTLVEVMISLCLIMLCVYSISKLSILVYQSKSYGESLTRATVLCNAQLIYLGCQPKGSEALVRNWHQDSLNPITSGSSEFYRFWNVEDLPEGKEVTMYVAWHDNQTGRAGGFGSLGDLEASRCPHIKMAEFIRNEE